MSQLATQFPPAACPNCPRSLLMQSVADADAQFAHKRQQQPDFIDRQPDQLSGVSGPPVPPPGPERSLDSAHMPNRGWPFSTLKHNPNRVSILTTESLVPMSTLEAIPLPTTHSHDDDTNHAISCVDGDYLCHKKVVEMPTQSAMSTALTMSTDGYHISSTTTSGAGGWTAPFQIPPAPNDDNNFHNRRSLPLKIALPVAAIVIIALLLTWFLLRRRRRRLALEQNHIDDDDGESMFDTDDQHPPPFNRRWQRREPEMLQVSRGMSSAGATVSPVEAAHTASRWSTQTSLHSNAPLLAVQSPTGVSSPPPVRQNRGLSVYSNNLPHEELPPYIDPLIEAMGQGESSAGFTRHQSRMTRSMLVSPPPYQAVETPPVTPVTPIAAPMH